MLHFAVIGALLFFGYEQMNPSPGSSERIVVTHGYRPPAEFIAAVMSRNETGAA